MAHAVSDERQDLAAFLRSRRARLSPLAAGLPAGPRRRTPGLRREEVAQLAGVGITWYTWFEQGRDIRVSAHFLDNLARALQLDVAERAHLYALAQQRLPALAPLPDLQQVSPGLQQMIDAYPHPAYVKTARWDVVAWNRAAACILGDYASLPAAQRNILWLLFTHPLYRRMLPDWASDARRVLARFRFNYGRAAGDPAFERLVGELDTVSPEFHLWWPQQDVLGQTEGVKTLRHPKHGVIEFRHTGLVADSLGGGELRLVAYMPLPGAAARRLAKVLAEDRPLALAPAPP